MGIFSGIMCNANDEGYTIAMEDARIEFNEAFEVLNAEYKSFDSLCGAIEKLELLNESIQAHDGKADRGLIAFLNQNNDLAEALGISIDMENFNEIVVGAEVSAACEGMLGNAWEAIKNFFKSIWEGIKNFFSNFFNMFRGTKSNLEKVKNDPKAPEKIANAPAPANPATNAAVVDLSKKLGIQVKMLPAPANNASQPAAQDAQPQPKPQAPASTPNVFGAVAIKVDAFIRVFNGAKTCYDGMNSFMSGISGMSGDAKKMQEVFRDTMSQPLAKIGINLNTTNNGKIALGTHEGALAFSKEDIVSEGDSYGDILTKAGYPNGGGIDQLIQCASMVSDYESKLKRIQKTVDGYLAKAEQDTTSKAPNSAGPLEDKAYRETQVEVLKNIGKCVAKVTAVVGEAGKYLDMYSKELVAICEKYQKIG